MIRVCAVDQYTAEQIKRWQEQVSIVCYQTLVMRKSEVDKQELMHVCSSTSDVE